VKLWEWVYVSWLTARLGVVSSWTPFKDSCSSPHFCLYCSTCNDNDHVISWVTVYYAVITRPRSKIEQINTIIIIIIILHITFGNNEVKRWILIMIIITHALSHVNVLRVKLIIRLGWLIDIISQYTTHYTALQIVTEIQLNSDDYAISRLGNETITRNLKDFGRTLACSFWTSCACRCCPSW